MTEPTPGPWVFTSSTSYVGRRRREYRTIGSTSGPVASLYAQARDEDGSLIAAAPDLLEACRMVLEAYYDDRDLMAREAKQIEAAIAKATGEAVKP